MILRLKIELIFNEQEKYNLMLLVRNIKNPTTTTFSFKIRIGHKFENWLASTLLGVKFIGLVTEQKKKRQSVWTWGVSSVDVHLSPSNILILRVIRRK